ncbi:hypothetical protein NQ317_008590 [Molorchus minor]|uniref:Uncharacterized protein n=1 Tax=Molorchus minor TaxID=1323400 RepID=A0ABQ9JKU0_9CUCU|nr:hypothetical protein NQ317_008590 [Molorchus minor]
MAALIKIQENVSMNDDILESESSYQSYVIRPYATLGFRITTKNIHNRLLGRIRKEKGSAEFTGMVLRRFTDRKNIVNTKVAIWVAGKSAVHDRYESYTECPAARTDIH